MQLRRVLAVSVVGRYEVDAAKLCAHFFRQVKFPADGSACAYLFLDKRYKQTDWQLPSTPADLRVKYTTPRELERALSQRRHQVSKGQTDELSCIKKPSHPVFLLGIGSDTFCHTLLHRIDPEGSTPWLSELISAIPHAARKRGSFLVYDSTTGSVQLTSPE